MSALNYIDSPISREFLRKELAKAPFRLHDTITIRVALYTQLLAPAAEVKRTSTRTLRLAVSRRRLAVRMPRLAQVVNPVHNGPQPAGCFEQD